MKKIFTFVLVFCALSTSFATIRRVNNNAGVVPVAGLVYTVFTDAHTDAVAGDTIYIEPSSNPYIINTITKRLVIIGNGYEIGLNAGQGLTLPYSTNLSRINSNPAFSSGSENSTIIGISFDSNVNLLASGLQIIRCKFDGDLNFSASNLLIDQCFFGHNGSIFNGGTNNTVKNCIIGESLLTVSNVIFDQCYIQSFSPSFVTNCNFTNCIINTIPANCPLTNTFSHCIKIGAGTAFPIAGINNNIEGVAMSDLFVDTDPMTPTPIKEAGFKLKAGSPAVGAGTSGQDIGPFGGATPYRLSGQPPVPVITNFFLSTSGSTASGLSGSITIKANN